MVVIAMELDRRGEKCEVRVSTSEKEKIQELASQYGLSVSAMIRQALIQKRSILTEQEINSILGQIRDSLSLISQTLKNFNAPIVSELQADVQKLKETIAQMEKRF
ncbi:MAG: ribbon-helix-helix protein, CopG family [Cyanobacteria bacterium P01_G01_bin.49]